MGFLLKPDLSKRKKYMARIDKKNKYWKFFMLGCAFCLLLVLGIFVWLLILLLMNPMDEFCEYFLWLLLFLIFASIPFFSGISLKNIAKYQCALPYSALANGILIVSEQKLTYIFWKVSIYDAAAYSRKGNVFGDELKYEYSIPKENVKGLEIDEDHICHIQGKGTITMPFIVCDEFYNPVHKKEECQEFQFLMCFEEHGAESLLNNWRNRNE